MSGSKLSNPVSNDAATKAAADHPLGLTVYDLPEPGQAMADAPQRTRSGRWKMLAVMLVCAAPVIASYFTYYVIRPEGRRNFGELIDPQRPLPAVQAQGLSNETVDLRTLKDQWLLSSVADGGCDADCERHLYLQRQLREGLGKEKGRLAWVWLRTGSPDLSPALKEATAQATVLHMDAAAL